MLPDPHAEIPVEHGERHLDRLTGHLAIGTLRRRDVATRKLRDCERPSSKTHGLDERSHYTRDE